MSIIGKPITSLAGGLLSQIIVTAPTGYTVTCTTPAGVVLTAIEISGTWTFSNLTALGTYTVVATDGTNTKTQNVVVDNVGIYNITVVFQLYLYNEGDECTSVTGGWSTGYMPTAQSFYYTVATFTKESTAMYFYGSGRCAVGTHSNNKIDVTPYSTLYFTVTQCTRGSTYVHPRFFLHTATTWTEGQNDRTLDFTTTGTFSINLIGLNREEYIVPALFCETSNGTVRISKIWLE